MAKNKVIISLPINVYRIREDLCKNLAMAGYKTWCTEVKKKFYPTDDDQYFVCIEIDTQHVEEV